jgi:DNA-binding beta-propeller fold protein YncE
MRSKYKSALAALVAVCALGAVASASASAAPPEFTLKAGEKFPDAIGNSLNSVPAGFETEALSASCSSNKTTGEITSAKAASLTLEWTGCVKGTTQFTSEGAEAGHIVITGTGTLVYIDKAKSQVGVLLALKEVKLLAGEAKFFLKGSLVVPISPINQKVYTFELPFHQKGVGEQEFTSYENEKGEVESTQLILEISKKAALAGIYVGNEDYTNQVTASRELTVNTLSPPPTYLTEFGKEGTGNVQFNLPEQAAIASNGDVYVADTYNDRVQELSPTGGFIAAWGKEGTGDLQFNRPRAIAVASSGNVYVADSENQRILEFSSTGTFIRAFGWGVGKAGKDELEDCTSECKAGIAGSGNGQFGLKTIWGSVGPEGIAVAPNGNVYVTDRANARVEEFTSSGGYVTKWGKEGSENGQFWFAQGVAVAANGDMYVADAGNDRVQEFSSSGSFIAKWGSSGSANGQFSCPNAIAVAPNADVYVADPCNNRVQAFSEGGEYLTQWGSSGTGHGQFSEPSGVAVSPVNGNVYVVDKDNDRLQEFEF